MINKDSQFSLSAPDSTVRFSHVQVDGAYGDDSILSEGLKEGDTVVIDRPAETLARLSSAHH